MHVKLLLLLVCWKTVNSNFTDEQLVDYYEQLIQEEKAKSSTYQFPKDARAYLPTNDVPEDFGAFDFIVVGGGSAGSVAASRLSEVGEWTVLLLEAGREGNSFTDIPSMSVYASASDYNWGFNSTPQDTCCLAMGGVCPFPRGKSLGGTSTINALVYSRGNRVDFDNWGKNNPGWSYEDVLPYFMKSENSKIVGDLGYHGIGGPLSVEYHYPTSSKVGVFLESNLELGNPITDVNGRNQIGANHNQFTTHHGRRLSSANAFLRPISSNRPNLKILTESYVTKLLLSDSNDRVNGVLFSHKNVQYVAKANKQVILSSGVVGSPQILMHSGIGPADHLQEVGIPVKKDLAVGANMHDHLTFYNMYFSTPKPEPSFTLREGIKQYLKGFGPLTISTNPQGISFFHLEPRHSNTSQLEVVFIPSTIPDGVGAMKRGIVHGYADKAAASHWKSSTVQNYIFQIVMVLLHPKTRGRVYLKSDDPYEYPLIKSSCLADPNGEDIEYVYKGIEKINELVKTTAFQKLQAVILPYPSCMGRPYLSKEYWLCVIRQTAMNAYHGGGTCSMGSDPLQGAVVDNRLRVHGIANLRVADTSVVPVTLSAHMNAPAIMVGERVADFIKEEYLKKLAP